MMSDNNRLERLKRQATEAIAGMALGEQYPQSETDLAKLLQDLQIYQAELEIQNLELQRAQQHLQQQRDHYVDLYNHLPASVLLLDDRGKVLDVNEKAVALFHADSQLKLKNYSMFRLFSEHGAAWVFNALKRKNQSPEHQRADIITFKRQKLAVDITLISLPRNNQLGGAALLILQDASVEAQLEQQQHLFGAIMAHSPTMIFVLDADLRIMLANREFQQFHQLPDQDLKGRSILDLLPSESIDRLNRHFEALFIRGIAQTYEYEYLCLKTHKTYYLQTSAFALKDNVGNIIGAGFITMDITSRMDAETRLRTALQIFSQGSEGIIIADKNGQILSVNKAFEHITGYTEADVIGERPSILSSGRHDKVFYRDMWQAIHQQGHWEGEIWNKRKNGEVYPEWLTISRVPKQGAVIDNYIAVFSDISERKQSQRSIEQLAYYDSLTGLANRNLLRDRVEQLVKHYTRDGGSFVLLFIDLDRFKEINDLYGHDVGDSLLVTISQRIHDLFRDSDTVCRLGGDEFVVVLPNADVGNTTTKIDQLVSTLAQPVIVKDLSLKTTGSIGIVQYPRDGLSYTELLQHADFAMYRAKANGKNRANEYDASMMKDMQRRLSMAKALESAMEKDEFYIVFQPIVSMQNVVVGAETLLRWQSEEFGLVPPDEFIPLSEELGLIYELGLWVLDQSLSQLQLLKPHCGAQFYVSVNVSAVQFFSHSFTEHISQVMETYSLIAGSLQLEITERIAMQDPDMAAMIIKHLKQNGIKMAMDDFGTGYSSLSYLKHLPIDVLKIDKSFVSDIGHDKDDEQICRAIINLATSLNLSTIAEGVETEEQLAFLSVNGCTHIQGYIKAKPMPLDTMITWLQRFQPIP